MASALSQDEANARDSEGDMSLKKTLKKGPQTGGPNIGAITGIMLSLRT